jgi:hypothetical protein
MSLFYKLILFLLPIFFLVAGSNAYIITIDGPDSVIIGSPLVISGATSFPEDTYFDLVLYYSKYTAGEVKRQRVIIDKTKQFRSDFETRDLKKGQYKIEVHSIFSDGKEFVEDSLGSSSVIRRVIQLVDRSDELIIESQPLQNLSTALVITGRVKGLSGGVVTLRVFGPDNFTSGPLQLITKPGFADTDGHFSTLIPVSVPGEYLASISDKDGFIGESSFNVTDQTTQHEEVVVITPSPDITQLTTPPVSHEPSRDPSPVPTRSPIPISIVAAGVFCGSRLYKRL